MPEYLSPGVYVEEVPSGMAPIAGVGTSTAGFIGVIEDQFMPAGSTVGVMEEAVGVGTGQLKKFELKHTPVIVDQDTFVVKLDGEVFDGEVSLSNQSKGSFAIFSKAVPKDRRVTCDYQAAGTTAAAGEPVFCTNFSEFKKHFGDFSENQEQKTLALAVHGFFNNGGTRCWVARETEARNIATNSLERFKALDDIAIVVAPGQTDSSVVEPIMKHCEDLGDRFAIIDGQKSPKSLVISDIKGGIRNSNFAAIYFPWINVTDPINSEVIPQPPSGHIAGIYARVDGERGVHKAPANEVIRGCIGLPGKYRLSKAMQDGLNPSGINALRLFHDSPTVWGARTIGGDANGEWKYINVRRLFIFLRESIDQGTQWVVFEPNTQALWAKIRSNISAFLTNVWRAGALFGHTPEEAFYVKCDEETNPSGIRDEGKVITEVGVAIVKPAEFVIFRISQWSGAGNN